MYNKNDVNDNHGNTKDASEKKNIITAEEKKKKVERYLKKFFSSFHEIFLQSMNCISVLISVLHAHHSRCKRSFPAVTLQTWLMNVSIEGIIASVLHLFTCHVYYLWNFSLYHLKCHLWKFCAKPLFAYIVACRLRSESAQ